MGAVGGGPPPRAEALFIISTPTITGMEDAVVMVSAYYMECFYLGWVWACSCRIPFVFLLLFMLPTLGMGWDHQPALQLQTGCDSAG